MTKNPRRGASTVAPRSVNASEQLSSKRDELRQAEEALAGARAAKDVDAAVTQQMRVEVLRGFVADLEREVSARNADDVRRRVAEYREQQGRRMAALPKEIAQAQEVRRDAESAYVAAIAAEARLRTLVEEIGMADQVLCAGFGEQRLPSPEVPPVDDSALAVLRALDTLRPKRRSLVVPTVASDSAEMRAANARRAAVEFVARGGSDLPSEVRALIEAAPLSAIETTPMRAARPGIDPAVRAMNAVGGSVGVTGI